MFYNVFIHCNIVLLSTGNFKIYDFCFVEKNLISQNFSEKYKYFTWLIKAVFVLFAALCLFSCGGGGGGRVAFSDKDQLHNGGGAGGFGTGNQTGNGFDPINGSDITSSDLLISQMAALPNITNVRIELVINGVAQEAIIADASTTTDVLPKISIGDIVSGRAYIYSASEESPRVAELDQTEIILHNTLKFKVPYKYEAYDVIGGLVANGTYYARDGINLSAVTTSDIAGWQCVEDGTVHYGSYVTGVRGDIRLDAVLQAGAGTYSITYVSSKQPVAGETYDITAAHTLPTPTAPGYTFDGWFEDDTYSGSAIPSISAGSTGDKTFYAKWTPIEYTVTYHKPLGVNATITPSSGKYTIETVIDPMPTVNCTTAVFRGWYDNQSYSGSVVTSINPGVGDRDLYGKFEATVTFDLQGGSTTDSTTQTVICGTKATRPSDPKLNGSAFDGWYKESSCQNEFDFTSATDSIKGNTTLYAKWVAITASISVTSGSTTDLRYGESVDLSASVANFPGTPTYTWNISPSGASAIADITSSGSSASVTPIAGKSGTVTVSVTASYTSGGSTISATSSDVTITVDDAVSIENLGAFLQALPAADATLASPYQLKIAGLSPADVTYDSATHTPRRLITILKNNLGKYLDLSQLSLPAPTDGSLNGAFSGCTNLVKAPAIPDGVSTMMSCFSDCTNLKYPPASIGTDVTNMNTAFSGCSSLQSAPTIPANVQNITYCFMDCSNLSGIVTINMTNTTDAAYNGAFEDCDPSKITAIKVPSAAVTAVQNGNSNVASKVSAQ